MESSTLAKPSGRLLSLDVFRGATIAGMMLVNNPGSWNAIFPQLRHAAWHGWTYTDTIFPFFLWIVGVAMTLSFAKRIERGDSKAKLFGHVVRRSVIIFLLGLFLATFPNLIPLLDFSVLEHVRIPGVLQRIAVCYLIASAIFLWSGLRGQIFWTAGLLLVYWIFMALFPVPGFPRGTLEPIGNVAQYFDSLVLSGHMWSGTKVWDPEGIWSTLPAIATTMFGIFTGHLLRMKSEPGEKTSWIFTFGAVLLFIGIWWDWILPINKNIWTSSYSVFMAGLAAIVFAFCYWIIDVHGYKKWTKPFEVFGLNAIAVFVFSGMLGRLAYMIKVTGDDGTTVTIKTWIYSHWFVPLGEPVIVSLYFAIAWLIMLYLIALFMYKMEWFLKV